MYLENIFIGSEDIRKQLPQESIMFENVHNTFIRLMKQLGQIGNCLRVRERAGSDLAAFARICAPSHRTCPCKRW